MSSELTPTTTTSAQPAAAYLASLRSPVGRRGMVSALNTVAAIVSGLDKSKVAALPLRERVTLWQRMDWRTLNAANVAAIIAKLEGAPASVNKVLWALRGVARAAWRLGMMSEQEHARIKDVKGATGSRLAAGRDAEGWEIAALMRTCAADASPAGARDGALLAMLAKTGMRRAELASITLADMTTKDDGVDIVLMGKGDKQRRAFIDNGALSALRDWLAVRSHAPGYLFNPISQTGVVDESKGLSTTALHKILKRRCDDAGVTNLSLHDFRRTVAGELLDAGADIATVAGLLGHSSVVTTAKYDRRPEAAKRNASKKISVPYFKRAISKA